MNSFLIDQTFIGGNIYLGIRAFIFADTGSGGMNEFLYGIRSRETYGVNTDDYLTNTR
jgi:hypothetical protein